VGALIGTWMAGGTIPMLIYYGLKIINPKFLALIALVVTAIVSLCTGTSWGSAGTIGVAFMGVAVGMGANLPMVAGAVVAGAYFGDKLSPLSDTTNIAALATGVDLFTHIRHLLWTTVPAFLCSATVYLLFGLQSSGGTVPEKVDQILATLDSAFSWNLLLLVPILALTSLYTIHRALRPVRRLTRDIEARAEDDLSPLAADGVPQEMRGIIHATNRLLTRIDATLRRESITRLDIVIGHSMGSLAAVELAKKYPKLTQSLILCSPPIYQPKANEKIHHPEKILRALYGLINKHPRSSKRLLQFADRHNIWPDAGFKADKVTAKSSLTALNAAIINQTTMADISQLKLPITILSGKLDPLIVERNLKQLAKEHKNIAHRSMTMQSHEITDKYAKCLSGIIKQHLTGELPLKSLRRINRLRK